MFIRLLADLQDYQDRESSTTTQRLEENNNDTLRQLIEIQHNALKQQHYDNIAVLDQQVGDLLNQLREDNLLENTIIFFFSDHGDGLPRMKRWVYDSGIQVPLLIRYPNQLHGGTVNDAE